MENNFFDSIDISLSPIIKEASQKVNEIYDKAFIEFKNKHQSPVIFDATFNQFVIKKVIYDEINDQFKNNKSFAVMLLTDYVERMSLRELSNFLGLSFEKIGVSDTSIVCLYFEKIKKEKNINKNFLENINIIIKPQHLNDFIMFIELKIQKILENYIVQAKEIFTSFSIKSSEVNFYNLFINGKTIDFIKNNNLVYTYSSKLNKLSFMPINEIKLTFVEKLKKIIKIIFD